MALSSPKPITTKSLIPLTKQEVSILCELIKKNSEITLALMCRKSKRDENSYPPAMRGRTCGSTEVSVGVTFCARRSAEAMEVRHGQLSSSSQLSSRRHVHLLCTEVQDHLALFTCGQRADACRAEAWGYMTHPSAIRDHLHQKPPDIINCLTRRFTFECILFAITSFLLLMFFIPLKDKKHFSWRSIKSRIDWEKNVLIDQYNLLTCVFAIVSRWIDKLDVLSRCRPDQWRQTVLSSLRAGFNVMFK